MIVFDKLVSLCKRRGFIFSGSSIYGGLANSFDYGFLGVELKNNIKQAWWKKFVQTRDDMIGIDAAIFMNPKVWEASGHLQNFTDPLADCKKCHERFRQDLVPIEHSTTCGGELTDVRNFNLMFKTTLGPVEGEGSVVYLRPELAQAMFVDFKELYETYRLSVPFGVAQIGKAFRNEITTGNFIFRTREFDLAEFEYFVEPDKWEHWFNYWLKEMEDWIAELGIKKDETYLHEIPDGDRAHYSKRTIDIEYQYPFGMKELYGLACRSDFDLKNHEKYSGKDLKYKNLSTGANFLPYVIEPTFGIDRSVFAVLASAYSEEEAPTTEEGESDTRVVLKIPKHLAPIKVAILPLSKKQPLIDSAKDIASELRKHFTVLYDETQSIGRRYRRQDEIGTPYCITIDFETSNDGCITVRDRDTMRQERKNITELKDYLQYLLNQA